ncbi:hypothetical protein ACP2W0_05635 [Pseudobacillus badius]|uniref:hypothetical protein n=1 Tax=Bacillus badius TaxID=1455 RepID=UPI0007B09889|nr:hypothetical protein [Bacillus badius]KZN98829.1 hypothetical protein A4244_06915 [Bacillus badius]MED0664748.1 hypothetical protein [Bacillus badius]OCS83765.1 hypothetical protein A6M11_06920 [Bacillus badius]OVE52947.1 hypothetical protein B1A98_04955 [Bacillus badius]TDW04980.1 hypothetical protein B0G66_102415 [Bacillus badius]
MNGLIIGLAAAGIVFFLLSFFVKDRSRLLEKEVEDLSLQFLQETYQLKKKIKVLEEELLIGPPVTSLQKTAAAGETAAGVNEILKNQVISLYYQGVKLEDIARQSSLSLSQVRQILTPYLNEGKG